MPTHFDYLFKITVVGCTHVGKSSISKLFCEREIDDSYNQTIGLDILPRVIQLDGFDIIMQCWDTGGSEIYPPITDLYYRVAAGIIVVFDVTTITSFNNVLYYITKAKRLTSNEENIKIILVGNKCDLIEQREVSYETAREFADSYNITYYEVSCKSSEPVEYAFVSLASMILKSRMQKQTELISPQQNNTSRVSRKMFSKCSIM